MTPPSWLARTSPRPRTKPLPASTRTTSHFAPSTAVGPTQMSACPSTASSPSDRLSRCPSPAAPAPSAAAPTIKLPCRSVRRPRRRRPPRALSPWPHHAAMLRRSSVSRPPTLFGMRDLRMSSTEPTTAENRRDRNGSRTSCPSASPSPVYAKSPSIWEGYFLWIFFLTEGARAEEKGRLVGRASVRALLPDPRATPCTPRMKPNAAARKNGTVAA